MKFRELFIKAAIVALYAVSFSSVLYYVCGPLLPYIGLDNNNTFYINNYYNSINKSLTQTKSQDDITIINTQDFNDQFARDSLSRLLSSICDLKPKAVGVDIRFPSQKDTIGDRLLKDVIYQNSSIIVLAEAFHGARLMPSIFQDDSLHFGVTSLPDYYSFTPYMSAGGRSDPVFSYEIYRIASQSTKDDLSHFLVNYSSLSFNAISARSFLSSPNDIRRTFIENKIVLVGDTDNVKDYHHTPFPIQGQEWTQGIFLHAYAIYSLMYSSRAMKTLHPLLNVGFCYVLCLIFACFFVALFDRKSVRQCALQKRHSALYSLFRPLFLFLLDIIIYIICFYCFTLPCGIVPDVVLYMLSVWLFSMFNDFVSNKLNSSDNAS